MLFRVQGPAHSHPAAICTPSGTGLNMAQAAQRLKALRQLSRLQGWGLQAERGLAAAAQPAPAPGPADDSIELTVDGKQVRVPKGSNVLQACDAAGVDIPR